MDVADLLVETVHDLVEAVLGVHVLVDIASGGDDWGCWEIVFGVGDVAWERVELSYRNLGFINQRYVGSIHRPAISV